MPDKRRPNLFLDDDPQRVARYGHAPPSAYDVDRDRIDIKPPDVGAPVYVKPLDLTIGQQRALAQQLGVPIPNMKKGGTGKKTGIYRLHAGEKVIPAKPARSAPARRRGR
jgi:hypothetical protein